MRGVSFGAGGSGGSRCFEGGTGCVAFEAAVPGLGAMAGDRNGREREVWVRGGRVAACGFHSLGGGGSMAGAGCSSSSFHATVEQERHSRAARRQGVGLRSRQVC